MMAAASAAASLASLGAWVGAVCDGMDVLEWQHERRDLPKCCTIPAREASGNRYS